MLRVKAGKGVDGLYTIHSVCPVAAMHMAINKARQNITVWHRAPGFSALNLSGKREASGHDPVRKNKMSVKV
ncbi:hypothetical protein AA14362_2176 [Acetobacter cerevisiae DSM 14362]|nr:hypothetical protein AA14362_2176 [Acetobacter cerevisiae DSM 14362]